MNEVIRGGAHLGFDSLPFQNEAFSLRRSGGAILALSRYR